MKEIICSDTNTAVLKSLLKILEILFGQVNLKCFTISDNAKPGIKREHFIKGTVEITYPRQTLKFRAAFYMRAHDTFGIILNPTLPQYLWIEDSSRKTKPYLIWNYPEFDVIQIGECPDKGLVSVWLEGNSANNRWSRPASQFETTGLCFDI